MQSLRRKILQRKRKEVRLKTKIFVFFVIVALCANIASAQMVSFTLQSKASSGTGATFAVKGLSALGVSVRGDAAGSNIVVTFQASVDGVNYGVVSCRDMSSTTFAQSTTGTASGTTLLQYSCPVTGLRFFQAPVTGGNTGTVTVTANGIAGVSANVGGGGSGGGGGVGGAGTFTKLPLWTPDGATLGDSRLSDNGTDFLVNGAYLRLDTNPALANFYFGPSTQQAITTGHDNLFLGLHAGISLTTGIGNIGIGHSALNALTTGNNDIAIGWDSQFTNSTANNDTSIGMDALKALTTGSDTTAVGYRALLSLTTGGYSVGVGSDVLQHVTTGTQNTAVGAGAAFSTTTGLNNEAIGFNALYGNTTGGYNIGIGQNSLLTNSVGIRNMALGYGALQNTTGSYNVAVGMQSGNTLTTGSNNIFLGYTAGYYETGSNTLMIDNAVRTNEADGRVKALMYGIFASAPASQKLAVNGDVQPYAVTQAPTAISTTQALADCHGVYLVNGGAANITITLPATSTQPYVRECTFVLSAVSTGGFILAPNGADTINGTNGALPAVTTLNAGVTLKALSATAWQAEITKNIPDCHTSNQALQYTTSTGLFSCASVSGSSPTVTALSSDTALSTCQNGDIYQVTATTAAITVTLPAGSTGTVGNTCSIYLIATGSGGGLVVARKDTDTLNGRAVDSPVLTSTELGVTATLETTTNWRANTSLEFSRGAGQTISFQPGLLTTIVNTKGAFAQIVKASTLDNLIGSSITFTTCTTNPVVTLYNCGSSTTCATPTTMAEATVTASGQAFSASLSSTAIAAGDYVAWAISAGACAALDVSGTAQIHEN
jgi:hypothetical protein